jgi:DNA-binding NarL/FixJ family response regulator
VIAARALAAAQHLLVRGPPPTRIVLSLSLPRSGAIAAVRAAKALWATVPLLVLATDATPMFQAACFWAGARGVLRTPVQVATFTATVGELPADSANGAAHGADPRRSERSGPCPRLS